MRIKSVIRVFFSSVLLAVTPIAPAQGGFSLHIADINAANWNIQGIHLALTGLAQDAQQLTLSIARLSLPEPFNELTLVNIRCGTFSQHNEELLCGSGFAEVHSKRWRSPSTQFALEFKKNRRSFALNNMRLADGIITLTVDQQGENWRLQVNAKKVDAALLSTLLQIKQVELKEGRIDLKLDASGNAANVKDFALDADISGLTGQSPDARFAAEKLRLKTKLKARVLKGLWQWQNHIDIKSGGLYAEPIYLDAGMQPMVFDAQGNAQPARKKITVSSLSYRHDHAVALKGNMSLQYTDKPEIIKAELSLQSDNLAQLSAVYLSPLFEQTALAGLSLSGRLDADFSVARQSLSALTASTDEIAVHDTNGRLSITGGSGAVRWSEDTLFKQPSTLSWQQAKLGGLPIGPSALIFLAKGGSVRLLDKTHLPFLGGYIAIDQFAWEAKTRQEPEISFTGRLNNLSLEQLSRALNWTPLSGSISGDIPQIEYRNKTLSLDGELTVNVFDGVIKISNLASSGLFSDFPRVYSEWTIDNLDLDQLTRKFKFGGITGKLSGYIRQLYLENWHPVSFSPGWARRTATIPATASAKKPSIILRP